MHHLEGLGDHRESVVHLCECVLGAGAVGQELCPELSLYLSGKENAFSFDKCSNLAQSQFSGMSYFFWLFFIIFHFQKPFKDHCVSSFLHKQLVTFRNEIFGEIRQREEEDGEEKRIQSLIILD